MSLLKVALLPIRIARQLTEAVMNAVMPPPTAELFVVDGMPEGVPPAALRPRLPAPSGWPFGEDFPRTCGAGRFAGGAVFWTDFIYDDHGATGLPVNILRRHRLGPPDLRRRSAADRPHDA